MRTLNLDEGEDRNQAAREERLAALRDAADTPFALEPALEPEPVLAPVVEPEFDLSPAPAVPETVV